MKKYIFLLLIAFLLNAGVASAASNKIIMAGGLVGPGSGKLTGAVWSTIDGANWTKMISKAPWIQRFDFPLVKFNNQLWLIGGGDESSTLGYSDNDVWKSSDDGKTWKKVVSKAPWDIRSGHQVVVFKEKLWLLGGGDSNMVGMVANDVWSSVDGTNWKQEIKNAPWIARTGFSALVFDNKIWVIGGNGVDGKQLNDVWSSTDGINWAQSTSNAGFSPRLNMASAVFKNQIFILGGLATYEENGYGKFHVYNDVWASKDGINWTKLADAPWSKRFNFQATSIGKYLFIFGGNSNSSKNQYLPDVWKSLDGKNWSKVKLSTNNPFTKGAARFGLAK